MLHNSERELERCLEAIRPEIVSGFAELIAVDNASPDGSAGTVAALAAGRQDHPVRGEPGLRGGRQPRLASRARPLLAASEPGRRARRRRDREARGVDGPAPASGRRQRRAHGSGRRRTPLHRARTAIALAGAVRGISAPSPPARRAARPRPARRVLAWRRPTRCRLGARHGAAGSARGRRVRRTSGRALLPLRRGHRMVLADAPGRMVHRRLHHGACSSSGGQQRFSHLCRGGCPPRMVEGEIEAVRKVRGDRYARYYAHATALALRLEARHPGRSAERRRPRARQHAVATSGGDGAGVSGRCDR